MSVSTCHDITDYQSRLVIHTACDSYCVANEEVGLDIKCNVPNGQVISFDSVAGTIYKFLVFGSTNTQIGNFGLSVVDYQAPPNDHCTNALPLAVNARPRSGTTINATSSYSCAGSGGTRRGVWYIVQANVDGLLTSTTCSPDTSFATRISIMTACNSGCVRTTYAAGDTSCPGNAFAWRSTWRASAGQDYYLIVHGETKGEIGGFGISVQDEFFAGHNPTVSPSPSSSPTLTPLVTFPPSINRGVDASALFPPTNESSLEPPTIVSLPLGQSPLERVPFNDKCAQADILQVNSEAVTRNSANASLDAVCGDFNIMRKGVYFVVLGNGRPLSVSTCSPNTNFPTRIMVQTSCESGCNSVFSEEDPTCNERPLALGRSAVNPLAWKTTWNSIENQLYYIVSIQLVFISAAKALQLLFSETHLIGFLCFVAACSWREQQRCWRFWDTGDGRYIFNKSRNERTIFALADSNIIFSDIFRATKHVAILQQF